MVKKIITIVGIAIVNWCSYKLLWAQCHQLLEKCRLNLQWDITSHQSEWSLSKIYMHDAGCLGLVHWDDPEGFLFCLQTGSETLGLPGSTNLQTSFSLYGSCSHCLLFPFWLSISHDPNFSSEGVELCAGPENPSTVAGSEPLTYSLCSVKLLLMPGLLIL